MSDFRARVIGELDTSKITQQIKNIENTHRLKLTVDGINTNSLAQQMKNVGASAGKEFANGFKNNASLINQKISSGSIEASIAKITAQYEKLGTTGHSKLVEIQNDIKELNSLQAAMKNSGNSTADLISYYEKYDNTLDKVKNSLTIVKAETQKLASVNQMQNLDNKMATWLAKNQRASEAFGDAINGLRSELLNLHSSGELTTESLKNIESRFKKTVVAATEAGKTGNSFSSVMKQTATALIGTVSAAEIARRAFQELKEGLQVVIELDTALIDLKKTSSATAAELQSFYKSTPSFAKELGVSTKEFIQATSDWSRLGYSLKDAQTMAQNSSIFAAISPEMDIEQATDGLISAMKAFEIDASESLDGVISKINIIGNTQAVSNEDIVNVLTRSSSAMKEANNTLDETIALATAGVEITRNSDAMGTALKTLSMRIRGYDEETEEYIGGIETLNGEIANLTKTASAPGGISLFSDADKTEFKSTTELLRDISKIYDELTDKQQAELLEKLAGKRQGQIVAAIINNFDTVEKSLASMANSSGTAMDEMEIIYDSIEYKTNRLKTTGEEIWMNFFDRKSVGVVIDGLTSLLTLFEKLTDGIGLFGTALTTVTIGLSAFKNVGRDKFQQFSLIEYAHCNLVVTLNELVA